MKCYTKTNTGQCKLGQEQSNGHEQKTMILDWFRADLLSHNLRVAIKAQESFQLASNPPFCRIWSQNIAFENINTKN